MVHAMLARQPGGAEVMEWVSRDRVAPGPGEVLVRHTAIGVNFIDVYYRSGLYPWPSDTLVPGAEAAGIVEAVGSDVSHLSVGNRVAYVDRFGAYCTERVIAAAKLVRLPDAISDHVAASVMLKGMTVHYLVNDCHKAVAGETVLVHAAAGGVGLLMGQWLKALGVRAIGTAGGPDKVQLARSHGYDHVIDYRSEDFVAEVARLTDGKGCAAVYDSVGADTWRGSLTCLKKRGMFVSFGQSSGMIEGFQLSDLARHGSLSANRPVLFDYVEDPAELARRASELFSMIDTGAVVPDVISTMRLEKVVDAHRALEARATTGSTVLIS